MKKNIFIVINPKNAKYPELISKMKQKESDKCDYLKEKLWLKGCKKKEPEIMICRERLVRSRISDKDNYMRYIKFFDDNAIDVQLLFDFYIVCGAETVIIRDDIKIFCNEDEWLLSLNSKSGQIGLRHNNYVRNFEGERYFVEGYHKQNLYEQTVAYAMEYIMDYDFKKLHNKKKGNDDIL